MEKDFRKEMKQEFVIIKGRIFGSKPFKHIVVGDYELSIQPTSREELGKKVEDMEVFEMQIQTEDGEKVVDIRTGCFDDFERIEELKKYYSTYLDECIFGFIPFKLIQDLIDYLENK